MKQQWESEETIPPNIEWKLFAWLHTAKDELWAWVLYLGQTGPLRGVKVTYFTKGRAMQMAARREERWIYLVYCSQVKLVKLPLRKPRRVLPLIWPTAHRERGRVMNRNVFVLSDNTRTWTLLLIQTHTHTHLKCLLRILTNCEFSVCVQQCLHYI